jgi:hypothetical protein
MEGAARRSNSAASRFAARKAKAISMNVGLAPPPDGNVEVLTT